eukprot:s976_g17.t1
MLRVHVVVRIGRGESAPGTRCCRVHRPEVGMNSMVQEFGPATEFGDTEDAECGRFILKADPVLFYQAMAAEDLLVQKIKEHFVRKDNGFEVDLVDNMELEEATQLCEV